MNAQIGDGTPPAPSMAVVYDDMDGEPVWYYINGISVDSGGSTVADLTDTGVLMGLTLEPHDPARGLVPRQLYYRQVEYPRHSPIETTTGLAIPTKHET